MYGRRVMPLVYKEILHALFRLFRGGHEDARALRERLAMISMYFVNSQTGDINVPILRRHVVSRTKLLLYRKRKVRACSTETKCGIGMCRTVSIMRCGPPFRFSIQLHDCGDTQT